MAGKSGKVQDAVAKLTKNRWRSSRKCFLQVQQVIPQSLLGSQLLEPYEFLA